MQSVGQKDTGPELAVRRIAHRMGYRYRLHTRGLAGRPDLVFASRRKAIFVNGCFWHGHGCSKGRLPKSRTDYWGPKIARNAERDSQAIAALEADGWRILTVWQCETGDPAALATRLRAFLESPTSPTDSSVIRTSGVARRAIESTV